MFVSSFQFETETEGGKLRRDVLAEGTVGTGGSSTSIISMVSGEEETFAFRRAVSGIKNEINEIISFSSSLYNFVVTYGYISYFQS